MCIRDRFNILLIVGFFACNQSTNRPSADTNLPKFELLTPEKTGVTFANTLRPDLLPNPLEYINVFNGGGVATVSYTHLTLPTSDLV